ncbi:hypothetical protein [Nocardiopsis sp. LOL_012]|uniref:hypothetical protein n=1 Tax=Nocardiopsis sp. LOL_012 TaxID=3345409 RepID=UPI003A84B1B7
MSNPTVTKLMTMVKGIFGRKESVSATGSDAAAEPAVEKAEAATATAIVGTPEASETANASEAAETSTAAPAEEKPAEAEAERPAEAAETTTEKPRPEAVAAEKAEPADAAEASADKPADAEEIAEEIAVAEADTAVSSDDVLEKVRKGNAPSVDELAVPTYDELTLPSVRARLRKLTVDQVRDLRAYEVAHQGRSDFIKMYDNRITKLEAAE